MDWCFAKCFTMNIWILMYGCIDWFKCLVGLPHRPWIQAFKHDHHEAIMGMVKIKPSLPAHEAMLDGRWTNDHEEWKL